MPIVIAVVGRPNVGKSTLFNRLVRRNAAITHDRAGVTRDRIYGETVLDERRVALVDTGGLEMEFTGTDPISEGIMAQAREAVAEAAAMLMVVDGREGLAPLDERVAATLRKSGKPVLLAVNKVDGPELEASLTAEFHALGFPMVAVSGAHGFGLEDLRGQIGSVLLDAVPEPEDSAPGVERGLRIALLGKPNAGKSSIINALLGEARLIVSAEAGTTRDAVDVVIERKDKRYTFVDTAGVRRRTKISDSLERYSVMRALTSAKRADVAVLVIDAGEGVSVQDKKLLSYIDKEKTPFLVVVNKIDLFKDDARKKLKRALEEELRMVDHAPLLYTSTLSREGLGKILPTVEKIKADCDVRVPTGELNRAMREALTRHQPPQVNYRRAKFYYLTQVETNPPTFVFFVNNPELVKDSYKKYLEKTLRKLFDIPFAPIRIHYRASRDSEQKWG
ncbi:GTP-binding protein engA [Desulfovibrio sp. X2]|uniref:ribosome biogenesis GTPase Der n=1 Tax=Desulfovibrio sp. X2 TaxID=941449 RepID=UPI000358E58D|nr:ribosome biogenesis GTPase Der [Desulfovibrio sp. X2]EPR41725.1 GTP-binding protein engA [Desulfovibrio sp. X2]